MVTGDNRKVYTVKEIADILRVRPTTVYQLLEDKDLEGFKVGRVWRIQSESLDKFIENQKNTREK